MVLADGIFYAADRLNATTIVDVATLTGSILTSLSNVFSGIWSTNETKWAIFEKAQLRQLKKKFEESYLHKDFHKGNESSKVADLASWSKIVRQDSSQAAMFLKEFTKDVDFIHCDINGTADINGEPQGPLIATLVEFVLELQK
ncbi:hypothetical protein ONA22_03945 [Mycoplasmopsis cynos]|uniref:hypothetical protein n=1 Tax=Mycoplasmopsis cynos TaxID=171284 RepID=UPI0024C63DDD|nr:hypothetical protein [Mycoplasmopsis cynos]WAM02969.1 hypothetical protein ONA22_03945 [Mycoplasmopsis cynos]